MSESSDILAYLVSELHDTRTTAAAVIDRAEALHELLRHADARAGELGQVTLLVEDIHDEFAPEKTRARVTALVDRAFPPTPTPDPEVTP